MKYDYKVNSISYPSMPKMTDVSFMSKFLSQ